MAELYGDIEQVKGMLRPSESASFGGDADARLYALQGAVSLQLEDKTGRVFGGTATATARTVDGRSGYADPVLMLPYPVRSVTTVALIGDYAATLESTDWALWFTDSRGDSHALLRSRSNTWAPKDGVNRIVVTAVWCDTANGGEVPDDVTYAANYCIAELFKAETASPAGFTGPDGATVPVRDPWKHTMVKGVIEKYRVATELFAF